jgi:hypothetical protein
MNAILLYNRIHHKNSTRKIKFYYTIHTHANILLSHKPKLVYRVPAARLTTTSFSTLTFLMPLSHYTIREFNVLFTMEQGYINIYIYIYIFTATFDTISNRWQVDYDMIGVKRPVTSVLSDEHRSCWWTWNTCAWFSAEGIDSCDITCFSINKSWNMIFDVHECT